jgi:hypothetical protein
MSGQSPVSRGVLANHAFAADNSEQVEREREWPLQPKIVSGPCLSLFRRYQNRQETLRGIAMAESGGNYHMDAEGNAPRKADRRTPVSLHSALHGSVLPTLINS